MSIQGYIFIIISLLSITSCGKNGAKPGNTNPPSEEKVVQRSINLYLFDKKGDTNIISTYDTALKKVRYNHDSIKVSGIYDTALIPQTIDVILWNGPPHIEFTYLYKYVSELSDINGMRFDLKYVIKWDNETIDNLNIIKDNDGEIRFRINDNPYKTTDAHSIEIPDIFFYK